MTIGTGYKTDKYFVYFTDIQLSSGHQYPCHNYCKKVITFESGKNKYVIYGSGTIDELLGALEISKSVAHEHEEDVTFSVDSFINSLIAKLYEHYERIEERIIEKRKYDIKNEEKLLYTEQQKKEYNHKNFQKIIKKIKKKRKKDTTNLMLVSYDSHQQKIRSFSIKKFIVEEMFDSIFTLGWGESGAEQYFSIYNQRPDMQKISIPELFLTCAGAYNFATTYEGVEGTPYIGVLDSSRNIILPPEESAILTNVSAARIQELLCHKTSLQYSEQVLKCLSSNNKQRKKILENIVTGFIKKTRLNIDISLTAIKMSAWGEIATRKFLSNQH